MNRDWMKISDRAWNEGLRVAREVLTKIANDGRSPGQKESDVRKGFVAEAHDAEVSGTFDWWLNRRKELQGAYDDGGVDKENGWGVKGIGVGDMCATSRVSDLRAKGQYVYEVNMSSRFIRYLGTFRRLETEIIVLPNGKPVRGAYVANLNPNEPEDS